MSSLARRKPVLYLGDDIVLTHTECGSAVEVVYRCPTCDVRIKGAGVRLVDRDGAARTTASAGE